MQVVFDSKTLSAAKRRQAWREAICEIYLQVDCAAVPDDEYSGFVREIRLGGVTLTDTFISPQSIQRRSQHIGHFDKDCYYLGIEHMGEVAIHQAGGCFKLRKGAAALYYANEPYELRSPVKSRQFWVELPRHDFDQRFDGRRPPLLTNIHLSRGLGRIVGEFCSTLADGSVKTDGPAGAKLGDQFMDILALALCGEADAPPADERSVQQARLQSVKTYIESNLTDPKLSLSAIAKQNGISLRYLHQLFRLTEMSVSEWLRVRRLQRCYDLLTSPRNFNQSITEIAYSVGFSSSSHFSNLFRAQFNARPSDVRGDSLRVGAPRATRSASRSSKRDR